MPGMRTRKARGMAEAIRISGGDFGIFRPPCLYKCDRRTTHRSNRCKGKIAGKGAENPMFWLLRVRENGRVMKTIGWIQLAVATLAILAGGCASQGYHKSDAAADSLQNAAVQVDGEKIAIDSTVATLNDLINNPAPDLKPQFERYSMALDRLIDLEQRNEKAAERASQKNVAYIEAWNRQLDTIQYEAIRNESIARKNEVQSRFNAVNSRYHETQQVVQPLISYFQDIRTALSTDLTMDGLQSVKPIAANAEQGARKVQLALDRLSDELAKSGVQMASTLPPPAPNQNVQAQGASEGPVESQHAEVRQ